MKLKTKTIYLNTIDLKDKTFLLSYGYDLSPLKQSIKQVGLLNPPVVRKKSDGTHQIICGYKRVRALKELGISSFPCFFIPAKTGNKKSLLLSLYDNSSHREFNLVEKSMAVNKLQNYYSEEEIVSFFASAQAAASQHPAQDHCATMQARKRSKEWTHRGND